MSKDIVGFAFDADLHCKTCTEKQFNYDALYETNNYEGPELEDSEGNPIHPIFIWNTDDWQDEDGRVSNCGDCGDVLVHQI